MFGKRVLGVCGCGRGRREEDGREGYETGIRWEWIVK